MIKKINLLPDEKIEVKCWRCDHSHFLTHKELKRKNINCLCGAEIFIRDGGIAKFKHPAEKISILVKAMKHLIILNRIIWNFERHLRDTVPFAVMLYVGWIILFLVSLFT